MRWILSLCLLVALTPAIASPATAADLSVAPRNHRAVLRLVRDYDGTAITMRRRPDGTVDTYFAERASPTRYFNGQLVTGYR